MAKDNKNMEFFRQGMLRAYQLAKEDGIEALEKELKFRNVAQVNAPLLAKELDKGLDDTKRYILHTVTTMTMGVLYSEFGFGKKRIERFKTVFAEATKPLEEGIVTWADIGWNLRELIGVDVELLDDLDKNTGMIKEG